MKRVSLVRHGESTWNASGRWQGQSDPPLSALGEAQGASLASWFAAQAPDRVECSDLQRAARTAALAGARATPDAAWRELFVGDWEGLLHAEVRQRFPDQLRALRQGEPVAVGGGEGWADLRDRAMAALQRLVATLPPGGHGIVFCHGGVIMSVVSAILALPDAAPRRIEGLANTSITEIGFVDGAPLLLRYNDASHLDARAPLGRTGGVLVRLTAPPERGEASLDAWPPPTDGPAFQVWTEAPEALRERVIEGLATPEAAARLGPLEGPAHVQVRADARVLVDYNLRCSIRA